MSFYNKDERGEIQRVTFDSEQVKRIFHGSFHKVKDLEKLFSLQGRCLVTCALCTRLDFVTLPVLHLCFTLRTSRRRFESVDSMCCVSQLEPLAPTLDAFLKRFIVSDGCKTAAGLHFHRHSVARSSEKVVR